MSITTHIGFLLQAFKRKRLSQFLVGPVDATRLRLFEIAFTFTFLLWMGRCFVYWEEWLTDTGFHLTQEELSMMGYPAPFPLMTPKTVPIFGGWIILSALLLSWPIKNGLFRHRVSIRFLAPLFFRRIGLCGLFCSALYAQGVDYMSAFTLNKLYVSVYAILMIAPGLFLPSPNARPIHSAAPLRVLQATLILQYFAAGLAKASGDWLKSGDVLWGQIQGVYRTDIAAWALRNLPTQVWTVLQNISLGFELFAPILFTIRRLRPVAFILGIGFHLAISLMMKDLIFFSLQMWTFYLLFIPIREANSQTSGQAIIEFSI